MNKIEAIIRPEQPAKAKVVALFEVGLVRLMQRT